MSETEDDLLNAVRAVSGTVATASEVIGQAVTEIGLLREEKAELLAALKAMYAGYGSEFNSGSSALDKARIAIKKAERGTV